MSVSADGNKIVGRGVLISPDGDGDLQVVLGSSRQEKSYFFQTAEINRFAIRKATIHAQKLGPLTDAQLATSRCGLTPRALTKLLQMSVGYTGTHSTYTADACLAEAAAWDYARPTQAQGWRSMDFYAYSETGQGYNKLAVAPDAGWVDEELSIANLSTMESITQTISGSGGSFVLDPSSDAFIYQSFSILFGQGSNQRWGDTTNMEIPISYVTALDDLWRLAIAVWIPSGSSGSWHYFIGRQCIKRYTDGSCTMGEIMPDFGTNQVAAYYMRTYAAANNGYYPFPAIPLLVKDIRYEYANSKFQPRVVDGATQIYCMPSGTNGLFVVCGTAPVPDYSQAEVETSGSTVYVYLRCKSTAPSNYVFNYTFRIFRNGTQISTTTSNTQSLAPGERQLVGQRSSAVGFGHELAVNSQTPQ